MPDKPTTGNAAAMRAALEEIYNEAQNICDYCDEQRIVSHRADKIERIVNTALAAPARNCDRFVAAADALSAYTKERDLTLSPEAQAFIWWLFEKGGAE